MKSSEIRQKFFDFFKKHGHEQVASSSLIPAQDPTLLFTNAGMNQFKDVFLGTEKRSYTRAVSIQKCMRAGGKHNDLDNVGFTKRHLTFFEMMGNFSFGDYFKKEAIAYAWDFLTKEMKLPVEKLHVSVFTSDDESYNLWHKEIGIPKKRIHRLGAKDNFWQMGDTGPCGPCSEIHLDRGPAFGCDSCDPACDCDRYLEIWNLVFMQYDRQPDGTDKPLKQTGVDTGMGLERLCSIIQNKDSVFGIDTFAGVLQKIELVSGINYQQSDDKTKAAFHVLADHSRAAALLIADGCAPSNEGRGYVLRKVIRRAALFTQKLTDKNLFPALARVVVRDMGSVYPDLVTNEELIVSVLESEVEKFSTNLIRGQGILNDFFKKAKKSKIITGQQAFKLYDTFGFPLELTTIIANEKGFTVDADEFAQEMKKQKTQSGKKEKDLSVQIKLDEKIKTAFVGYETLEATTKIIAIIHNDKVTGQAAAGTTCWLITEQSPFYTIGGGQVSDKGRVTIGDKKLPVLAVQNFGAAIGVKIKLPVGLKSGATVTLTVNKPFRTNAMKNHTATHLLQAALISLLGKQIKQSGSLVTPDYLRFDFTYHKNLSPDDVKRIEDLVNQKIMDNIPVQIEQTTFKRAIDRGVIAFFGDKYNPEQVRVVSVPGFSAELCGGTHVQRTGDIGSFKITEVTALSAGHRRIFAVTGPEALHLFQDSFSNIKQLSQEFKVKRNEVLSTIEKQQEQLKKLRLQIKQLKKNEWQLKLSEWEQQVTEINKIPFLFLALKNYGHDEMREISDRLMQKQPGFYFIISSTNGKSIFLCSLTAQLADRLDLKEFSVFLKDEHGLRGGGSKTTLQGGGGIVDAKLKESIITWLRSR